MKEIPEKVLKGLKDALDKLTPLLKDLPPQAKAAADTLAALVYGKPKQREAKQPQVCVCPKCKEELPLEPDQKCEDLKCPKCGGKMQAKSPSEEKVSESEFDAAIDNLKAWAGQIDEDKAYPDPGSPHAIKGQELKSLIKQLIALLQQTYGYYGYRGKYATSPQSCEPPGSAYASPKSPKKIMASATLVEAVQGTDGRVWDVCLIRPGMSANRFNYESGVLEKATPLFEGLKAYVDHPTATERKELPERSIRDIAGWYENLRFDPGKGIVGRFTIAASNDWLARMMMDSWERGNQNLVGFSIFAEGKTILNREGGKVFWNVTEISRALSADVVTAPAAGGRVLSLVESEQEVEMLEDMTKEDLRKARPDLFESIMKEAQAAAPPPPAAPPKVEDGDARKRLAEVESALAKMRVGALVESRLSASKLPALAQTRIRETIGESATMEQIDAAITREKDYLAALAPVRPSPTSRVREMLSEGDRFTKALDGMMSGKMVDGVPPFRGLIEAYAVFKGVSPVDVEPSVIMREALGYDSSGRRLLAESLTTASWAEMLGDSITRQLLVDYRVPELDDWKKIVSSQIPVKDFRTQRRVRLGGYGLLPTVAQGGTYQSLTSPTDEEVTWSPSKHGGLEDLTIETILNDDLGGVRQIPQRLARAAKITLYRFVFDFLKDNAAVWDGVALFHANHGNLTASALADDTLNIAKRMMRDQTAYGANIDFLMLKPKLLIVPNELDAAASHLVKDEYTYRQGFDVSGTKVGAYAETNIHRGSLELIVVDYWTDADNWFLVADPKMCSTLEIGFLGGKEEPELFTQDQPTVGSVFTADKISYKIRHIYGGAILDFRPFHGAIVP